MTTTRGTTFTTTMRVINRVHGHATYGRTDTLPALGASLAQRTQAVLVVRDFAQGRTALSQYYTHFAGAQTHGHVGAFTGYQLSRSTSGTRDLSTLARLQLDTMHGRTHRNIAQRQAIAGPARPVSTGKQPIARHHALGRNDVATLTVGILQQRDVRGTVRVIFDALNDGWNAILVATKVDQTVMLLVTTADVAGGDATVVVTTTGLGLLFQQRGV